MRRTHRGVPAVATLLSIVLVGAGACGGGFQQSGESGSTTSAKLRVLVNISPVLTKQFYANLVAPYEKAHPGVTVTIEAPTAADVSATLQQELAAGSAPDLVTGSLSTAIVPQLSELPDDSWVTDAPYAVQSKVGGKIWQAGSGTQVQSVVFYNKTAFGKAGISAPPRTFDEFTADLVKLKAAGYVPTQTAGDWVTGAQVQMMANPNVLNTKPDWFAQRDKKSVTFADSNWTKVLDVYQGWVTQGLTPANAMGLKYQDSIDQFVAGKSGTYIMGSWLVPTLDSAKLPFDADVFPMPTFDGSPAPLAGGPSIPWSILKSSKNQAAALDLVKYLVSDKTAVTAELAAEGNFRTGFDYQASALNKEIGKIVADAKTTVVASAGQGDNSAPTGFGDEVNKLVQGLYVGETSPKVISALDDWYTANAK
ncbi:ABC transporter substrate-binding protein [Kutzneria sp. 744]|uniref:ABC transporter substrate-binding protein n=1 Tax=Kutzneria sp. (strain 744) TaxID=345341 RepID=UPI0003EEE0EF|nr:extracellular solute-binding protein [Kutzneria sp. 744]EWM11639.1 secreted sugar-binding protein [Kutzneria sp. 744]